MCEDRTLDIGIGRNDGKWYKRGSLNPIKINFLRMFVHRLGYVMPPSFYPAGEIRSLFLQKNLNIRITF